MSKSKPKDKKNDNSSLIEKQFEAQKRDMIDADFTIKRLEQKLTQKSIETQKLYKDLEQVRKNANDKIDQLILRTNDDEKRLANQINKITDLEIKTTRYESQINSLKQELSLEKQFRFKEVGEIKIKMQSQRMKLDLQLKDLQIYMEERESRKQELEDLRDKIQNQKAQRVRQVADKEREKVQATDKLRDQMLNKIRDMRTDLLSLKKEQLETTTRLTILQNHQLTSELQYQSKQTEKLIFKDEQMQTRLKKMNQQLVIHKEVQDQLAKRAHFSKGVIKKLNEKVAQLQKQLEKVRERGNQNTQNMIAKNRAVAEESCSNPRNQEIICSLQKQLEQTERKYAESISKIEAVTKQRDNFSCILKKYENSSNDLIKLLHIYYQQIIDKPNLTNYDKPQLQELKDTIKINLAELKQKQVQEWTHEEVQFMIKFLLNLLRPFLTRQNIMIPSIRKNIVLTTPDENSLNRSLNKLPKLPEDNEQNLLKSGKKKIQDLPVNIASKIVASNLRQWGTTVRVQHNSQLKRKFKISQSYR